MLRSLTLIIGLIPLLGACVSVPDQARLLTHSGDEQSVSHVCHAKQQVQTTTDSTIAKEFSLASWNIHKLNKTGWLSDLDALGQQVDVILLQEAYLKPELHDWLDQTRLAWDMSPAFEYKNYPSGVLTAGKAQADVNCSLLRHEPYIYIPKAALISFYRMEDSEQLLLVANIHGINFTTNHEELEQQLRNIQDILDYHQGPVIVAGDFNTWSNSRMNILNEITTELGLSQVQFEGQQPATHMRRVVDHIYYRGLTAMESKVLPVTSSDHHPLTVRFALNRTELL